MFELKEAKSPGAGRAVKSTGGRRQVVGTALIQVPFKKLGIVLEIYFMILTGHVLALLCQKDLYRNGVDISIFRFKAKCEGREQNLEMVDYFLVHNWKLS